MNDTLGQEPLRPDDMTTRLDAWLRACAPEALPDDGFTERTLQAVRRAAVPQRSLTPAQALALEFRRHAAQARLWRWSLAGIGSGAAALLLAVLVSPSDAPLAMERAISSAQFQQWALLWVVAFAGALWLVVRELRAD